jgi:tetratricopeptide (TPR) repeat protein
VRLNRLAVDLDPNDPDVLGHCARNLAYTGADLDGATEMIDRATRLYPNSAFLWNQRGWVYMYGARPAEAVDFLTRAMRISPRDAMHNDMLCGLARKSSNQAERSHHPNSHCRSGCRPQRRKTCSPGLGSSSLVLLQRLISKRVDCHRTWIDVKDLGLDARPTRVAKGATLVAPCV